jgi:hypothetical protein
VGPPYISYSRTTHGAMEQIVKTRPGGMEVRSTGDFIDRVKGINKMIIPIEEVELEEIDKQPSKESYFNQKKGEWHKTWYHWGGPHEQGNGQP